MDGFETASHIKRRERTRDIPIIFLTAISREPQHAFRGYSAGAVDYLAKPFDPWVLRAKVAVFVELYLKNRQLREQAEMLRRQLNGSAEPEVLKELGERLTAVEDQLELVSSQARVTPDPTMTEHVGELTQRIARLRDGIDALRAGEP
jgi:response regulator RpfG family c-di-GMP phosphodiesterase